MGGLLGGGGGGGGGQRASEGPPALTLPTPMPTHFYLTIRE